MKNKRSVIILIIALALAAGVGVQQYYKKKKSIILLAGSTLSSPAEITPFKLIDSQGQPFTDQNLRGHWSMIFFGFTHCPQLCPKTLAVLNRVYQKLEAEKQAPMPQVIFISVDPERDDVHSLNRYTQAFNPHFLGVTGDKNEIKKLAGQMSVMFMKSPNAKGKNYNIDHSGTIVLLDPNGKMFAVFTLPHDPDQIAKDIRLIVGQL